MATAIEGLGSWTAAWWVMLVVSAAGLGLAAALLFADRGRRA
jgi:hypothetical protein